MGRKHCFSKEFPSNLTPYAVLPFSQDDFFGLNCFKDDLLKQPRIRTRHNPHGVLEVVFLARKLAFFFLSKQRTKYVLLLTYYNVLNVIVIWQHFV